MKAAVYRRYGLPLDVVRIEQVPKPVPGDEELLIAVRAASLNLLDTHLMRGRPAIMRLGFGLRGPKLTRPGVDLAGEVEAAGSKVKAFRSGDRVFGSCRGSLAEYACLPEARLAAMPSALSFEQAASIPVAGLTALQGLRDAGRLQAGQKVLIVGASGGIGTFAVQIAKALGAHVTGVCSTRNLEMVRSIGADRVLDYTAGDYLADGSRYDLVFDIVSSRSFGAFRRVLTPGGRLVPAGMLGGGGAPKLGWLGRWAARTVAGLVSSLFTGRKMVLTMAKQSQDDLAFLAGLVAAGKVTPVIDRSYPLDEAPEALDYLLGGHARGKVIVTMKSG